MLTVNDALDRLDQLVRAALSAGATAADAIYLAETGVGAHVRLGKLEDISRTEGVEVGLRVFVGQSVASVSSSDLSPQAFAALVERSVAMARVAPPDPYAGLAPEALLMRGALPDLDLYDPVSVDVEVLTAQAHKAEAAALTVSGVSNSEGASASAGEATIALCSSHGFAAGYATSSFSVSASVVASSEAGMERDYAYHAARHRADLEAPEGIGQRAAERAVARLNPKKLASKTMPVLFDPRVSSGLIGHLIGAISGPAITRKSSFLLGCRGAQVFAPGVTIQEDPHRVRGLRSRPVDGEGVSTIKRNIVENGVLTTWLLDNASARQLGEQPTGHATRGTSGSPGTGIGNLVMLPGKTSRSDLIGSVKHGLYVTELIGMGVNGTTGDYSRGAAGFLIENGKLTVPVSEVTVACNLKEMFATIAAADDLEFRYGIDAPTILIPAMTVAGN